MSRRAGADQLALDLDALFDRSPAPERPGADPPTRPPGDRAAVSAREIAARLGRPEPTPEQVAVIEAGLAPLLVVAGAGSGKTETMASRVVWLIANGLVEAESVLGLTFTRKAASELADRVRSRLDALRRKGFGDLAGAGTVTVSTYHSYAAGILTDHGLRLGLDSGHRLLGEAGAWQIVDDLVERWDGDMSGVDAARATVVDAVLALAGECAEHLVGVDDIDDTIDAVLHRVTTLPARSGESLPGPLRGDLKGVLTRLEARRRLLPLVSAYQRRKRELDVVDFGDQVALAARLAAGVPEVAAAERARFAVVLLDEYQDTSHAQLTLLRSLFGAGHPVTAVGDPNQSIYGWRGASSGNLQRFPIDFPDAAGTPAPVAHLATSWRNDSGVLAAANLLAEPLRRPAPWAPNAPRVAVPHLAARPDAGAGAVTLAWHDTLESELDHVANVVENRWRAGDSVAVLCRARSQFPLVEAALRGRGLPVEVVGLGGLLHTPEVADLRAALEVLHDPSRGDALVRLLTGAAWRLGPADLVALGAWARQVLRPAAAGRRARGEPIDEASLAQAIDALPEAGWVGPRGERLSPAARGRLHRLAALLRRLRGRASMSLPDLVAEVERALLLDIEVAAVPGRRPGQARANLDAFADIAARFAETGVRTRGASAGAGGGSAGAGGGSGAAGDRPGLGAFLAWLSAAETEERGLEAPVGQVQAGAVQVLTVHAAKGLEWDTVAVPGLVEGSFPNAPDQGWGWLKEHGALPYPLRGDATSLPHWAWRGADSQQDLRAATTEFRAACGAHLAAEERRLAYVALTRARRHLLLTGAVWADGSRPRRPSRFLEELREAAYVGLVPQAVVTGWAAEVAADAVNPREERLRAVAWPVDPLGGRRPAVEAGADLVRAELAQLERATSDVGTGEAAPGEPTAQGGRWAHEVDALLAERAERRRLRREVELPGHLSASHLVALAEDAAALAERLRRPMPAEPSPHGRRGSAFHAWLEQRFRSAALVDVDELPGAADEPEEEGELAALQAAFLASPWAELLPEAVEVSLETPVAGVMLRGRVDAVFRVDEGGVDEGGVDEGGVDEGGVDADAGLATRPRWDVVDWKTGAPPVGDRARASRAVQLAVYRLAWASLAGVDVADVGAAFFYAATGETVRPVDLLDAEGLAALIRSAVVGDGDMGGAGAGEEGAGG